MRFFQSTVVVDEVAPPPPFLTLPNVSRDQFRFINNNVGRGDKHRLPTPEKVAIMELSNSFERHRLGKQQQLLTDMNKRCREQEVSDLSSKLTAKCSLQGSLDKRGKEMTFYSTNFMYRRQKTYGEFSHEQENESPDDGSPTNLHSPKTEKSYKHFPARRIIKHQTRYDFQRRPKMRTPRAETDRYNGNSSDQFPQQPDDDPDYAGSKYLQRIYGNLRLDQYQRNKCDPVTPLTLQSSLNAYSENKLDSIITARVNLGTRQKTIPAWGENKSNGTAPTTVSSKSHRSNNRSLKPLKPQNDSDSNQQQRKTPPQTAAAPAVVEQE